MNIIVDDNCKNKEQFDAIVPVIKDVLGVLLRNISLLSLDFIIIADSDPKQYYEAIQHYAGILNIMVAPDRSEMYSVSGKCLDGIASDGNYKQIIVVKSAIINIFLQDYCVLCSNFEKTVSPEYESVQWLGISMILHEIGHAIDNERLYSKYQYINTERGYDFSQKSEQQAYFLNGAINLWGEFFAESFIFLVLPELRNHLRSKEHELLNCLCNYRGGSISQPERARQIIYLFAHTIAEIGEGSFAYSVLNNYPDYIPFLQIIEKEMFRLLDCFPDVDMQKDFNKLAIAFNRISLIDDN